MITYIVGVQFLLFRINFSITMDNNIPLSFLLKNFIIDIQNMFIQDNWNIIITLPGMSTRVY